MVEYTFGEIERHDRRDDCWLIIHGKVYDVTKFKDDHPGGSKVLVKNAGMDATEAFTRLHKHSHDAKERMKEYYIGDADMTTVRSSRSYRLPVCKEEPQPRNIPNYEPQQRNIPNYEPQQRNIHEDMTTVPRSRSYRRPVCEKPRNIPNYESQQRNIPNCEPQQRNTFTVWQLLFILVLAKAAGFFGLILVILVFAYAAGIYTIEN